MALDDPRPLEDGSYHVVFSKAFTLAKAILHYHDGRPVTEIDFSEHANPVSVPIGGSIRIRPTLD